MSRRKAWGWQGLLLGLALGMSQAAQAGPGWYIGLEGGWNRVEDVESQTVVTTSTETPGEDTGLGLDPLLFLCTLSALNPLGEPLGLNCPEEGTATPGSTARFTDTYEDGETFGLITGYAFEEGLRTELELGYRKNDLESRFLDEGFGDATGSTLTFEGDITGISAMFNIWYDFTQYNFGLPRWFNPYLGIGVGATRVETSFTVPATETTPETEIEDDDTPFSYQGGAGIGIELLDELTLSLDYRYLVTDDPEYRRLGTNDVQSEYVAQAAMLSLRYVVAPAKLSDADSDGVPDGKDKCPGTPAGAPVDADGCPLDTDGDGVPDYADKCPNTPRGVQVNKDGCPLDTDGDGVPDFKDKCPGTPPGTAVDENGCPLDSDGDGVPDARDKCPDTPPDVLVDKQGCPLDSDGDGVPDGRDKCPGTPPGIPVDANGCPFDADGDGVPDYLDQCPNTPPGTPVLTNGCGVGQSQVLRGVTFEFDSARLTPNAKTVLDITAEVIRNSPGFVLEIQGHTCDLGKDAYNQGLSQRRADATRDYLAGVGIDRSRLVARGYGEANPRVPNKDEANREINRRIELKVLSAEPGAMVPPVKAPPTPKTGSREPAPAAGGGVPATAGDASAQQPSAAMESAPAPDETEEMGAEGQ